MFVHLAPESETESIRRNGIKPRRVRYPEVVGFERMVFAMPVTNNYFVSHQWLRELRRAGQRTFVAVYFRIPDDELVMVGHYHEVHEVVTAAEAVGIIFNAEQAEGFEVVIPRKIEPAEIHRVKSLPQITGWRVHPGAKGTKPCGCSFCTKGTIKSRRIRESQKEFFSEPDEA